MFFGDPFTAYDHVNYINFLNEPILFYMEPIYTGVGFLVNWLFEPSIRFSVVFVFFTLPPLWFVWRDAQRRTDEPCFGMVLFACILTKSFFVGWISQRFFFTELWLCALMIVAAPALPRVRNILALGMLHFSALSLVPSFYFLKRDIRLVRVCLLLGILFSSYVYLRFFSSFELFGYDYSRYLNPDPDLIKPGRINIFSVLQVLVLASICWIVAQKEKAEKIVVLLMGLLLFKIIFYDIEVFSRITQIQLDMALVAAGISGRRSMKMPILLYSYSFGFFILQMFFTSTSEEVFSAHQEVVMNVLTLF